MTWSITDPADTEAIRQGASRIRELKVDLQTAFQVEHVFPGPTPASPKLYYAPPYGPTSSRPASSLSTAGRLYANSDTHSIQRDRGDGTNWDDITSPLDAGIVAMWAGGAAPAGWLLCDGSQVSRTTYANLFTAIGVRHGSGDGSTTFNLPDFRGRFPRGTDHGVGRDPDAASRSQPTTGGASGDNVGSVQAQETAKNSLSLSFSDPGHAHGKGMTPDASQVATGASGIGRPLASNTDSATTGITVGLTGGSETRPQNIGIDFIIKT